MDGVRQWSTVVAIVTCRCSGRHFAGVLTGKNGFLYGCHRGVGIGTGDMALMGIEDIAVEHQVRITPQFHVRTVFEDDLDDAGIAGYDQIIGIDMVADVQCAGDAIRSFRGCGADELLDDTDILCGHDVLHCLRLTTRLAFSDSGTCG